MWPKNTPGLIVTCFMSEKMCYMGATMEKFILSLSMSSKANYRFSKNVSN
ncbi:protein of unknown function [uncultured Woeseiaceae bacterium]|uniref:Uncharacterized protein n=1 Tax=uncultured Woeseiaceae bacterium TaxID=1983305 RepID=A0A7D9D224_9GAMM|nr:protein of unknown function [uncultured Woeseiaceae bacterium]